LYFAVKNIKRFSIRKFENIVNGINYVIKPFFIHGLLSHRPKFFPFRTTNSKRPQANLSCHKAGARKKINQDEKSFN
jgi:hypothetical protein